ncbi:MAG TPA: glycosyltransferase family 2 protein [Bacteroidales bacterium]|nr:glycosyltransferase family 2 protein [Bacteroidales bacterium]
MSIKKQRNDVSVVIVSYNTEKLLYNCIKSIYEQTSSLSFEVIVVDNNSSDNSTEVIAENFPDVKVIKLPENVGFGNASNLGADYANSKYVLFLNSDTILKNNAIKLFYDYFETHNKSNDIGAIGGLLIDENDEIIHSFGRFPKLSRDLVRMLKDRFYKTTRIFKRYVKTSNKTIESGFVDYITGADLFVPVEVFKRLGGFDKYFFMYFEESDLQLRMQKEGLKRMVVEGPSIIHLEGASFNKPKTNLKRIYYDRSMLHFYSKNLGFFSYCFLFFVKLMNIFSLRYTFKENIEYIKALRR